MSNSRRFPCTSMPRIHNTATRHNMCRHAAVRGIPLWYLANENGIAAPVMNRNRGMTRSHALNPCHVSWSKCHNRFWYHSALQHPPADMSMGCRNTSMNRSNPLNISRDASRAGLPGGIVVAMEFFESVLQI